MVALFITVLSMIPLQTCGAQLNEQLQSESPAALAQEAIEKGSAIRGAIVFPQESAGCTTCHIAGARDLLGPDLTRMNKDRSDEFLVEAVLNPSKVISKGFESTTVITSEGRIYTGRLLSETDEGIVLREMSADRKQRTIPASQIEQIRTNPKSLMPDGLADKLKNRQQFLDLVRYLMELRDTGGTNSGEASSPRVRELDRPLAGLTLIHRYQCVRCHTNDLVDSAVPPQTSPRLAQLAGRLDPAYLRQFIADPQTLKPGTPMPDLLGSIAEPQKQRVADQITHYLVSQANQRYSRTAPDSQAAERGRQLYHSVGCVACHSPRDESGAPLLQESSVSLGPLRYSLQGLTQFLEEPHAVRPAGRMPNMNLGHWEAVDIANYLLMHSKYDDDDGAFQPDREPATAGKRHFRQLGCATCHGESETPATEARPPGPSLTTARPDSGCLSDAAGAWPKFTLSASDRDLIRDAMTHFRSVDRLTADQQLQLSLTVFRCTACHQRGTLGGVPDERSDYFTTTNPNLGPQGRIPPPLTGVGAKLKPKWMREVLVSGRAIRPYVRTRMPQYGAANIEHMIELFQGIDQLPPVTYPEIKGREQQKTMRDAGFELVSNSGMNCIACHTFQMKPALTMPAVDLTEMHERLKPDWFYHYLRDPKRFSRGTVMPSFWPGGRSVRNDILDGDPHLQIAALWEWMKEGRQARTPRGLIREPMELVADREAVMLRRSYPGIGKRGIGVGYPEQVNLAFDAEQMRLAILWQGKFADPAGVWRSQGHGMVRPLASELYRFQPGPELDDKQNPWVPDGSRPPRHRFRGYELDDLRRPVLLYQLDDVQVQDYCFDLSAGEFRSAMLRRTVTLQSDESRSDLEFRIRPQGAVVKKSARTYIIDNRLVIEVVVPEKSELRMDGDRASIAIPADIRAGQKSQIILIYQWLP